MAVDEVKELSSHLEDVGQGNSDYYPSSEQSQLYGNLFFLLQTEPRHIATLARLVTLSEIDTLLQTVMFTLYGNQYESREEHLLLTMFQLVLAAQFETTTGVCESFAAKHAGVANDDDAYLKNVISSEINRVIEDAEQNLEINPLKIYEEIRQGLEDRGLATDEFPPGVSTEEAGQHPKVVEALRPRIAELTQIAGRFLDTIIGNKDATPYGIRWICKQIRSLTRRRYPEATDSAVCSLIGGFFFLRFINPAIVTPQAYMLIETAPTAHPRRALTLVAKVLQSLANKPTYAKEQYMAGLTPFLNELCEVGDFYDSMEMDQYVALTKHDITLHVTLNELYNTHALLRQHQHVLAPSGGAHLRQLLDALGSAPALVPRSANASLELRLFSRWETPILSDLSALAADNALTQHDIMYVEAKSILVQIIRSMPALQARRYTPESNTAARADLLFVAEQAATSRDAALVRKGIKVREMLGELSATGALQADGHRYLAEEIVRELAHLGSLRDKVEAEIVGLQDVLRTIGDYNGYLQQQLGDTAAPKSQRKNGMPVGVTVATPAQSSRQRRAPERSKVMAPIRFALAQLERDGVVCDSKIPENRRHAMVFALSSPQPAAYVIELLLKGREKPIIHMDLNLDDLLERQHANIAVLDLEYVHLSVPRLLDLLKKSFMR
ncbi:GTPase-activating protein-like protein [Linderina pennispora]|uniref:GTPase-activating protein-like protein n=1 Tax=Linderina pennispora TaxID=61395 RepID=A0A1Y1W2Y3_9FUNG|nr:GTPase-activating protein-like protein [Linderina pennispora]ORX67645.1 GTPase-activating protein-like protein [Linderina pennispora]